MARRIYIATIATVLVGATISFGLWSLAQISLAINTFEASYNQLGASRAASLRPASDNATTTGAMGTATSTSEVGVLFTPEGGTVYIGCTYQIPFQASTTVHSLEIALIDDNTGEKVGPIASGLAAVNELGPNSKSLGWKVGVVWPGSYYLKTSKVNDVYVETRSSTFTISGLPEGTLAGEQENTCKESGGLFE